MECDIFHYGDDCSAALLRVCYQRVALEREGLLSMGRDSGVETHFPWAGRLGQKPLHNAALSRWIFKQVDAAFARGRKLLIVFHTRSGKSVASVEAGGGDKQMNETNALSAADADIARRRTTAQLGKPATFAGRSSRALPERP